MKNRNHFGLSNPAPHLLKVCDYYDVLEEEEIIIIVESDGELEGLSGPETDSEEELVCPTAEQAAGAGEVEEDSTEEEEEGWEYDSEDDVEIVCRGGRNVSVWRFSYEEYIEDFWRIVETVVDTGKEETESARSVEETASVETVWVQASSNVENVRVETVGVEAASIVWKTV